MMDGETLSAARQLAGLSQKELGQQLGVSTKTINNWENDRNRIPSGAQAWIEDEFAEELLIVTRSSSGTQLASASDLELLAELAKRLARRQNSRALPDQLSDDDSAIRLEPTVTEVLAAQAREAERQRLRAVAESGAQGDEADVVDAKAKLDREQHESQQSRDQ